MWKYDDPNAYRVVLIEAGHIGQNIMLAATQQRADGMPDRGPQPLDDPRMHRRCKGLTDAPVYALTLCVPGVEKERELRAVG